MIKADKKGRSYREKGALSSLDKALLDEVFSIIACIATRLTKVDSCGKNGDEPNNKEVIKP
jgi:hypothetical protein